MTCRNGSHYECDGCGWRGQCDEYRENRVQKLVDAVNKWASSNDMSAKADAIRLADELYRG